MLSKSNPLIETKDLVKKFGSFTAFTVPGDGSLNYIDIINNLQDVGYEGWFVVEAEQDPKICPPLEYAKIGYKSLSESLIRSGYEIDNNV